MNFVCLDCDVQRIERAWRWPGDIRALQVVTAVVARAPYNAFICLELNRAVQVSANGNMSAELTGSVSNE